MVPVALQDADVDCVVDALGEVLVEKRRAVGDHVADPVAGVLEGPAEFGVMCSGEDDVGRGVVMDACVLEYVTPVLELDSLRTIPLVFDEDVGDSAGGGPKAGFLEHGLDSVEEFVARCARLWCVHGRFDARLGFCLQCWVFHDIPVGIGDLRLRYRVAE